MFSRTFFIFSCVLFFSSWGAVSAATSGYASCAGDGYTCQGAYDPFRQITLVGWGYEMRPGSSTYFIKSYDVGGTFNSDYPCLAVSGMQNPTKIAKCEIVYTTPGLVGWAPVQTWTTAKGPTANELMSALQNSLIGNVGVILNNKTWVCVALRVTSTSGIVYDSSRLPGRCSSTSSGGGPEVSPEPDVVCSASDITLNHGVLSPDRLSGNTASGDIIVTCSNNGTGQLALTPYIIVLDSSSKLTSNLSINGASKPIVINFSPGGNTVNLSSKLSTFASVPAGNYSGSAVLTLTMQ